MCHETTTTIPETRDSVGSAVRDNRLRPPARACSGARLRDRRDRRFVRHKEEEASIHKCYPVALSQDGPYPLHERRTWIDFVGQSAGRIIFPKEFVVGTPGITVFVVPDKCPCGTHYQGAVKKKSVPIRPVWERRCSGSRLFAAPATHTRQCRNGGGRTRRSV